MWTLSLRTLKKNLSLETPKRILKGKLSLRTLYRTLSKRTLKRTLSNIDITILAMMEVIQKVLDIERESMGWGKYRFRVIAI